MCIVCVQIWIWFVYQKIIKTRFFNLIYFISIKIIFSPKENVNETFLKFLWSDISGSFIIKLITWNVFLLSFSSIQDKSNTCYILYQIQRPYIHFKGHKLYTWEINEYECSSCIQLLSDILVLNIIIKSFW